MKKVRWEELKRTEFMELAQSDAVVIIPVGSMEQHGEHLPINTDTNCCYSVALRAAESLDDVNVLVLPPLWVGYSPHHMPMEHAEGSLTLSYHTFANVLTDIASSVHAHGFRRIMFLNGHGGNAGIVSSLRLKLGEEKQIPSVHGFTYWELPGVADRMRELSESDKGDIGHAGEFETSLQLFLQPELVDTSVAEWASGVVGDPRTASRDKGALVFDAVVRSLMDVIRRYHAGEYEDTRICRRDL